MVRSKNSAGQVWRTKDKYWAGYETTERMNVLQIELVMVKCTLIVSLVPMPKIMKKLQNALGNL